MLPVTRTITKHNASEESIAMDIETFTHVSHVHSFGKHMPVNPTGEQFFAVYDCHELAKHTVLAGFQFDPDGYLPRGFVFDPGGFTQLLKFLQATCDVIFNDGEQSVKYPYMRNASNMRIVGTDGHTGWSCFRQKGSDKNHTCLSPLGICEICGFVFTSDQVYPEGSMIIGSRIGTYFSLRFGVYSCIFGMLCGTYVDSSTWYSSYMIHVGISFPYGSYVQSTLIPTDVTLPWPIIASYIY